jgi:hypothetical protein
MKPISTQAAVLVTGHCKQVGETRFDLDLQALEPLELAKFAPNCHASSE